MDTSTVTEQLRALMVADTARFDGVTIERSEFVNDDADRTVKGWIGIYKQRVRYTPETMAAGDARRFDTNINLLLVIQRCASTGALCEVALEELVDKVFDFLLDNDSIGGLVEQVKSADIAYSYDPRSKKADNLFMQTAVMLVELEVANG